jgi:hypothetical protein
MSEVRANITHTTHNTWTTILRIHITNSQHSLRRQISLKMYVSRGSYNEQNANKVPKAYVIYRVSFRPPNKTHIGNVRFWILICVDWTQACKRQYRR